MLQIKTNLLILQQCCDMKLLQMDAVQLSNTALDKNQIKNFMKIYALLAGTLLLIACGGPTKEEKELLAQAATLHNAAYTLAGHLETKLETLKSDTTVAADSVTALLAAIEQWEEQLVEVPGNEAHHEHAEGEAHHHHHEHGKETTLTPAQMLTVQQEMKMQIDRIAARIENLTSGSMNQN